jgi:hypothetical protein
MARLVFPDDFDERAEDEAETRGCLSHVLVELEDGRRFAVAFVEPLRLEQDLDVMSDHGRPWIAEVGMIVLPEVTRPAMENAVADLVSRGFFDYFRPWKEGDRPWDV